jgi:sigma-B regulation protein RsbU (phosphoserine phosphatase)
MLLGVDEAASYEQEIIRLGSGDLILFYTDGVCDAINPDQEAFGMARVRRVLLENKHRPAEDVVAALVDANTNHTQSADQYDDITILAAKRR